MAILFSKVALASFPIATDLSPVPVALVPIAIASCETTSLPFLTSLLYVLALVPILILLVPSLVPTTLPGLLELIVIVLLETSTAA